MKTLAIYLLSCLLWAIGVGIAKAQNAILVTYDYQVLVPATIQRIPPSTMKQQAIAKVKGMRKTFTLYHRTDVCAFAAGYKNGAPFNVKGANASYADTKKGEHLQVESLLGKTYLVKEPLPTHEWLYGDDETKVILGKVCHKATLATAPNKVNAWYTEEMPAHAVGPLGYNGLPGLILEIEFAGELICQATKINEKASNKIRITPPTAKTIHSRENYETVRKKILSEKGFKPDTRIPIQL